MNVPAIAKKTFDELHNQVEFITIVRSVLDGLKKIADKYKRAQFIHGLVDEYNEEVFSHPLVKQFSPCKMGCTGCCHTQVSVTDDEAELLVKRIREGISIDENLLKLQMMAKNETADFFQIPYEQRKCIFLDGEGACKVYDDRPSVCRTNAVLGSAEQCDTTHEIQKTVLVRTPKSDMVIYASYYHSKSSGTLPYMVGKILEEEKV